VLKPRGTDEHVVGVAVDARRNLLAVNQAYEDRAAVAALVNRAIRAAGLGEANPAAPLADIISPGSTVLLKPNWVLDVNHSKAGMECMVTHPTVLLAALDEVMKARPGRVIIGDAPIQMCKLGQIITDDLRVRVAARATCPSDIVDFRRTVAESQDMGTGVRTAVRDQSRYVLFNLGSDSLLEPVSTSARRFRITNYDPRLLAETHGPGHHQYLVCREAFEADVVIGLPKLKTHRKAGLTGALKNLVGINGNKDFLPHHRRGSVEEGGDCYGRRSLTLNGVEEALDRANMHIGEPEYTRWYDLAMKIWRRQDRRAPTQVEGSWHGNDTVWRTVLDLNRLLQYGRADGTLSDTRMRRVFSLTDAIVAGEKEGPLAPSPRVLGCVTFSSSSPFADLVHAALMGFDGQRLPVVREGFGRFRYPLTSRPAADARVSADGVLMTLEEAASALGQRFEAPATWAGHIEREAQHASSDPAGRLRRA